MKLPWGLTSFKAHIPKHQPPEVIILDLATFFHLFSKYRKLVIVTTNSKTTCQAGLAQEVAMKIVIFPPRFKFHIVTWCFHEPFVDYHDYHEINLVYPGYHSQNEGKCLVHFFRIYISSEGKKKEKRKEDNSKLQCVLWPKGLYRNRFNEST